MATMQVYTVGLDQLSGWDGGADGDYMWALFSEGEFVATHTTVAAVVAAGAEVTVTGYARNDTAGRDRTVDLDLARINYTAPDPDWGALAAGEDVVGALLYRAGNNDAVSTPVGWWAMAPVATDSVDPFTLAITDGIVCYLDQAGDL